MDEVDKIIIHSLNSVGSDIDESHTGLSTFTADMIYQAVLNCVEAINMTNCNVPRKLPPGMSQKFRAGSALAKLVTDVGYKGEVGYQTFLYSNEADIRKILMFLVDKLPRDAQGGGEDSPTQSGSAGQLRSVIKSAIETQLKQVWLPAVCCQHKNIVRPFKGHEVLSAAAVGDGTRKLTKDMKRYYEASLPDIRDQCGSSAALCSALIENNALQLVSDQNSQWRLHSSKPEKSKAQKVEEIREKLLAEKEAEIQQTIEQTISGLPETRFTQLEKLQHTASVGADSEKTTPSHVETGEKSEEIKAELTEEEVKAKQEEELERIKSELQEVTNRISKLTKNIDKATAAKTQVEEDVTQKKVEVEEHKKLYQVKKKTLDVLPESELTISKLKQVIAGADARMKSLETQWLDHKMPLEKQVEDLRTKAMARQTDIEQKLTELQTFKQQMKSLSEEARQKDDQIKTLTGEYSKMSKDVSRSSYTKRIIEIVGNIKKQKRDIDKVLNDTKLVQKDLNLLSGKLDRTFTVTDELIFKDAKKDESVRAAYKYLASLHDNFTSVRVTLEDTGVILREIRQLEDQIDQEKRNEVSSTLDKILDDFKQMRKENQQLMVKVKD